MAKNPLTGGCQCGGVRYEVTAEPSTLYCCHCTDCQKQSSSAFGMSLIIALSGFRLTRGTTKVWRTVTDSGTTKTCHFCPDCGSRIYHGSEAEDGAESGSISVKAGTLDDRSWLRPVGNLWTRSAQPWVAIPDDTVNYAQEPDEDDSAIRERWRAKQINSG